MRIQSEFPFWSGIYLVLFFFLSLSSIYLYYIPQNASGPAQKNNINQIGLCLVIKIKATIFFFLFYVLWLIAEVHLTYGPNRKKRSVSRNRARQIRKKLMLSDINRTPLGTYLVLFFLTTVLFFFLPSLVCVCGRWFHTADYSITTSPLLTPRLIYDPSSTHPHAEHLLSYCRRDIFFLIFFISVVGLDRYNKKI